MDDFFRAPLTESLRRHFPDESEQDLQRRLEKTVKWCSGNGCRVLALADVPSPLLAEIPSPPSLLFVMGNPSALALPSLAVVGSRRPSAYGLKAAVCFARSLARLGFCVVSGLARGIDGASHRGALDGKGVTVAVLGHGLDRIYPASNAALGREILESGGCLVSEYPPGVPPLKHHFPQRNRILSGLSLGTLVIEAAERSGSLITVRHALEQNREVFVIPARFDDTGFNGSHRQIQEGAKLVLSPADILMELNCEMPCSVESQVVLEAELEQLKRIFGRCDGEASLDLLFSSSPFELQDFVARLERAREMGLVAEISPQNFVWLEV